MDNYYGIGNDGDHPSFSGSGSGQYTENYVGDSFDPGFNLADTLEEYTSVPYNASPTSSSLQSTPALTSEAPSGASSTYLPRSNRRTMYLEPMPVKPRKSRALSPDSLERRRRQNRASQIAFRERKRKKSGEMYQELVLASSYNQQMYTTMRDLLRRADELKLAIEQALALQPPNMSEWPSRSSSETHGWSVSDSEGPTSQPEKVST